ncbi:hypothetical protein [Ferrimonas gelatinilytica]|uniref:YXWGXW repeat-containing protein n=1 Tax=Ferrimonas gelatinilytica TaxID=1255257 RepID=A0ABP9RT61_9GAMM
MKWGLIGLGVLLLSGPSVAEVDWHLGVQWHTGHHSGYLGPRPIWYYGGRYRHDPFWGRHDPWFDRYRHDRYRHDRYHHYRYRRPQAYILPDPPRPRVIPPPVTLRQEQVAVGSRATLPANARTRVGPDGVLHEWEGVCYRLDWVEDRYLVADCPE